MCEATVERDRRRDLSLGEAVFYIHQVLALMFTDFGFFGKLFGTWKSLPYNRLKTRIVILILLLWPLHFRNECQNILVKNDNLKVCYSNEILFDRF